MPLTILYCLCCALNGGHRLAPVLIREKTGAQQVVKIIMSHSHILIITRVGTVIVATTYLQLIQNSYMFRSFTVLQCSHQHCVQPVASDVEVVGYL